MPIVTVNEVVSVKPSLFQANIKVVLEKLLQEKTLGRIKNKCGKIKNILEISNITQLKMLHNGHAQFDIAFKADVFMLTVADEIKGLITCVNKAGISVDTPDYKCGIPAKLLEPFEYSVTDNTYIGKNVKVSYNDLVTLKVLRVRQEENFYHAICNLVL